MSKKLWIYASGFFAGVGMLLAGLVTQAQAQWGSSSYISLNRTQIAHSIHNEGMSGKKDNRSKLAQASFGYPMGRSLKVYSGGSEREGWNAKSNTAGEGFWVLSNTGGTVHGSFAGARALTSDIVPRSHDMTQMPEAYLGLIEDGGWALAQRTNGGGRQAWTEGGNLAGVSTNWWPASNGIASPDPQNNKAVVVWNFRFGRYNSNESYASRIASGELPQYSAPAWVEALSEDEFPEQIGIQEGASTATGLEWTRKWFGSGSNDYDHFLIVDNLVENKSGATVENIYIAFQNRIMSGQSTNWHGTSWNAANDWAEDDYTRFTLAPNYLDGIGRADHVAGLGKPAGLQRGVDLANAGHAMVYVHDGESDNIQSLWPDVGDPYKYASAHERYTREQTWVREGMMQHSQYFGLGTVDAFSPFMRYGGVDDETYVDPHDNPATALDESAQQPASVLVHQYRNLNDFDYPSPDRDSDSFIYDAVANGGYAEDHASPQMSTQIVAYGPYTLAPGEKTKVVIAYVAGTAAQHAKYADYRKYPQPFTMGFNNLYGGLGAAPVKYDDRKSDIPLGEDVLFDHFENAIQEYNWGYDVPNQPPNVKIAHDSNLQGKTQIRWSAFAEDATDPDYAGAEAQDLRGYRIYRSSMEYQGDWEFVAEYSFEDARSGNLPAGVNFDPARVWTTVKSGSWPQGVPLHTNKYVPAEEAIASSPAVPGTYTFDDAGTNAGFPNWYSVRYYDSGHADFNGTGTSVAVLESSHSPELGGQTGRLGGIVPVVPGAAVFDALEERVRVVPNPFKSDDDLHTYSRQQNMRFINLPGRCRIDIYDVTGQRTWTMFNNDPLKAELTYIQLAENRPSNFGEAMFPGIYFWKCTSLMPGHEGKVQSGTFAIIK